MDKDLLRLIEDLDDETQKILARYNSQLHQILKEHSRGDQINDTDALFKKIAKAALFFGGVFALVLVAYNSKAAKISITKNNDLLWEEFKRLGANNAAKKALNQQRDRIVSHIEKTVLNRQFPGTKVSLTGRITTLRNGSERVVHNIITVGIKEGKSSWQIAKEIEAYVTPNPKGLRVAPWTITRRELGKPISYIPKGVPAGSVEYNAMRIARTETVFSYQQAPYLADKDKWYYNGTLWMLSRSHPKDDICDDYAAHEEGLGRGVWRVPPHIPHPHCMCTTQTQTVPTEEMLEWFAKLNWS